MLVYNIENSSVIYILVINIILYNAQYTPVLPPRHKQNCFYFYVKRKSEIKMMDDFREFFDKFKQILFYENIWGNFESVSLEESMTET